MSKYISDKESKCRCGEADCDGGYLDPRTIRKFESLRNFFYDSPLPITSGVRCAKYNKSIGGAAKSKHLTGEALDLFVADSRKMFKVIIACEQAGFTRLILYKDKPNLLHIDISKKGKQGLWVQ